MDKKETTEKFDNITQTLQQLLEHGRVKAGLLKLEAREAWADVEKVLDKIGKDLQDSWEKVKQDKDEALLQSHLGMMEAFEEWNEVKGAISRTYESLKLQENIDRKILQSHLAKMETEDRFEEQRKQWQTDYNQKVKPQLKKSMDEMQKEMETLAKALHD